MSPLRTVIAVLMLSGLPAAAAVIAIDAGHTVAEPGAISPGNRREIDFNRALATRIARDLERAGHRVVRISLDGPGVALADRPRQADGADLFISIHHDSLQEDWIQAGRAKEFSGFATFISPSKPAANVALHCAQQIGAAMIAVGEHPSLYHAVQVKGENRPFIDRGLGIHQFDELLVLRRATQPAVLLEAGVIANPLEEERLADPHHMDTIAGAVAGAIGGCIGNLQPPPEKQNDPKT